MSSLGSHPEEVDRRLAEVRLLALDVDGTLTDGRVVWAAEHEIQSFCVHDGQGLAWLLRAGLEVAWITGRGSKATRRRAQELGIERVHVLTPNKGERLESIQQELGIPRAATASMGDDLPDLALARRSGVFIAPANARAEVREAAQLVTAASAGNGAVRELCERILRAQGRWQAIVEGHAS